MPKLGRLLTCVVIGALCVSTTPVTSATAAPAWVIRVPTLSPSWIFPFQGGDTYSVVNINYFQQLMYRPLYWVSAHPTVAINQELSLARNPVFSDANRTVTISLRPNVKWSNGDPVRSGDIVFFLNLMAALPGSWAAYVPPLANGTPLSVVDITQSIDTPNDRTIVLHLRRSVNPRWFLFNQLSQITPLPRAWDLRSVSSIGASFPKNLPSRYDVQHGHLATKPANCWGGPWIGNGNTGPGSTEQLRYRKDPSGTATVVTDSQALRAQTCVYVKATLDAFANDLQHLANRATDTGRIWSIVDGPWQLSAYSPTLHTASFRRRDDITVTSGPSQLRYVDCPQGCLTSALNGKLDWFGVDAEVVGHANSGSDFAALQRKDLADAGFTLHATYPLSINYAAINFASRNGANRKAHAVFAQNYFRHALQDSVDQRAILEKRFNGIGVAGTGPVPADGPRTRAPKAHVQRALRSLQRHGWRIEDGVAVCRRAGADATSCGRGIPTGTKLEFDFICVDGGGGVSIVRDLKRSWRKIGVRIAISTTSFSDVISTTFGHATNWDFAYWGGWLYAPDYLATGESLFATGSASNAGSYSNPTTDRLITSTVTSTDTSAISRYATFIANDVPVVWLPSPVELTEVRGSLHATPSRVSEFTPERWHR